MAATCDPCLKGKYWKCIGGTCNNAIEATRQKKHGVARRQPKGEKKISKYNEHLTYGADD